MGNALGGLTGILPILKAVTPLASSLLSSGGGSSPTPAPATPVPAPAPVAPTVSTAPESREEPVVDTEAARIRAQKRRVAAESSRLFQLTDEDDTSVVLTKSLLGD